MENTRLIDGFPQRIVLLRESMAERARGLLRGWGFVPDAGLHSLLLSLLFRSTPGGQVVTSWRERMAALFPHINLRSLRPGDAIRFPLQLLWLALVQPPGPRGDHPSSWSRCHEVLRAAARWWQEAASGRLGQVTREALSLPTRWLGVAVGYLRVNGDAFAEHGVWAAPLVRHAAFALAAAAAIVCITTPFDVQGQAFLMVLLWAIALLMRRVSGQGVTMLLIAMSVIASTRYLWWRVAFTLNWDADFDLLWGVLLLVAECYAWLVLLLGYFQTAQPLRRTPAPMPDDASLWPTVDIFIPTYNEPLKVLKPTVIAAMAMDWPRSKFKVYILDDGRREELRRFAEEIGAGYVVRPDNRHAKAGNLNHALGITSSEFVAIFDCDHVPTRSFLQSAMGWFLRDEKLALVQTPHHFFSPDPFERNLGVFRRMPSESELFHGLIQDGNDLWNATFFCGSCAVLRRGPLEEVGGIAVETVTEDAHTALKLQRRGYATALVNIPLAAGLATESLSAHIAQRIRWARGMAQIFRLDNPFLGKGLGWAQRLSYGSSMLHFFNGGPRLIFLTAPLAFLLFHAYVIHAGAIEVALYVLPHLIHAAITNSRLQGSHRRSFWAEVYEAVLAWYIVRPTTVALFNPHKGEFNVTPKGGMMPSAHFDWFIALPFLILAALNLLGFCVGFGRIAWGPEDEVATAVLNIFWTSYNLVLLGGAIAIAAEPKQTRFSHRLPLHQQVVLHLSGGQRIHCRSDDISDGGAALVLPLMPALAPDDAVSISLTSGAQSYEFRARVVSLAPPYLRLRWDSLSPEEEIALVKCTFSRPGAWTDWTLGRRPDALLRSLIEVVLTGIDGYRRLAFHVLCRVAKPVQPLMRYARRLRDCALSLLPRTPLPYPAPNWNAPVLLPAVIKPVTVAYKA